MRRFAPCVAVFLAAGAVGCQDSTAPEATPEFEIAVVHAAPGAGEYAVEVGDEVLSAALAPMRALVRPVPAGERTVAFNGTDAGLTVDATVEDLGRTVVLMDGSSPELRAYTAQALDGDVPITLVNAVPGATLEVRLERAIGGAGAFATLGYGSSAAFGLPAGGYSLSVAPSGSGAAPVPVHDVSPPGERRRGITIIAPGAEDGPPFEAIEIWFGPADGIIR